jgi:hypothetical protein
MKFLGGHIGSYLKLKSLSEVHRLPPFYVLPTPVANFLSRKGVKNRRTKYSMSLKSKFCTLKVMHYGLMAFLQISPDPTQPQRVSAVSKQKKEVCVSFRTGGKCVESIKSLSQPFTPPLLLP